jgi:hypothetical protein
MSDTPELQPPQTPPPEAETATSEAESGQPTPETPVTEPTEQDRLVADIDRKMSEASVEHCERAGNLGPVLKLVKSIGQETGVSRQVLEQAIAEKYADQPEKQQSWQETLKFVLMAAEIMPENLTAEQQELILKGLAEIVAEGHLDAETLEAAVGSIEYVENPDERFANSQQLCGYQGVAFWAGDHIVLTPRVFGKTPDGRSIDIKHILKHEVSHQIVDSKAVFAAQQDKLKNHFQNEPIEPDEATTAIIRLMTNAPEETLPEGLRLIIHPLKQLQALKENHPDFIAINQNRPKEEKISFERFLLAREMATANEVMTEITACYMESDGQFEDFFQTIIARSRPQELARYLRDGQPSGWLQQKLEQLKKGELPDDRRQEVILEISGQFPRFKDYYQTFRALYDQASLGFNNRDALKGLVLQHAGQRGELGEDLFNEFTNERFSSEPASADNSGSKDDQSAAKNLAAETVGLFQAFGQDFNEISPAAAMVK